MEKKKTLYQVAIFGRTNVGKSTLFNRLTESNQALTSKTEGTTRDSNVGEVTWRGKKLELVDTGGVIDENSGKLFSRPPKNQESLEQKIQKQALNFIKNSDLIIFLVDVKTGLLPQDEQMAQYLKKIDKKNILLVVNKVDDIKYHPEIAEFNKLGLGNPAPVSAITGSGTGDLLDLIVKKIKGGKKQEIETKKENIPVCIIGKPNVGKSSLLNSILGEEKVIVSDVPHTTREPQNTEIVYKEKTIALIDTAGISRKGTKTKSLENLGIKKSLASLKKSLIALLIIDIAEGITHQDCRLVEEITNRGKSVIIIANKWDLIKEKNTKEFTLYINRKFPFASWAPIHFVSAQTGRKVNKILDSIIQSHQERHRELSQSQLDKFLNRVVKLHPPAKAKGIKAPYIYKINQTGVNPPEFCLKIGSKDTLHTSYINFIKNQLREKFGFSATPIKIYIQK